MLHDKNECPDCVKGYKVKYKLIMTGKQTLKVPQRTSVCMSCKGTGKFTPKKEGR